MNDIIYMVYEALNEYDEKKEVLNVLEVRKDKLYIELIDGRQVSILIESIDEKHK